MRSSVEAVGSGSVSVTGVHDVLAGAVDRGETPGVIALVARGDEVHVDAVGTMAFGESAPIGRDTIFRISSMTKPVTAAATMALVDDGTLKLDEPVDGLIPELADRRVLRRGLDSGLDDVVATER